MSEWQPIETLNPANEVLLWCEKYEAVHVGYKTISGRFSDGEMLDLGQIYRFSHWMPLPNPPDCKAK